MPTIRTPDQRLRVFVSSTLKELAAERAAAAEAVRALRLAPVMFELGARPHPPRDLYRAYLAQSDVFVGIYWQTYGWVAPGETISGLEDEYRLSGSMPKLIYIKHADAREPRLAELVKDIKRDDRASYRSFTETAELRELVQDDLAIMLTERFAEAAGAPGQEEVAPRHELPVERGELIGRAPLVSTIVETLGRPEIGIVTLTGPGGTGKTRLAIHVGHALRAAFEDHVYYVDLSGVRAAADTLPSILTTLEIPRPPDGGEPETLIVSHLRRQSSLLVLDNFEQVLEAAPAVARIAASCPRLKVLVTSRESLRVRSEQEQPVPPLGLDAATLFEQRAREIRPDFRLDVENRAAVEEICRRLDGLPLAVELAAARTRVLSPQAMLKRLDQSLSLLTSQRRDLPERQQTLRATLSWSYQLLRPEERAFFRRLGVFAGGFSEEAAGVITGDAADDTLDGLTSLSEKSLLARDEQVEPTRFHLLETVREYALERLTEAGEDRETLARHGRWVRDLLAAAQGPMTRHAESSVWGQRLALEEGNVRAALRFASSPAGDRTLLWEIYCRFAFCLLNDARAREVKELYDQLVPGGEAADPVLAAVAREQAHRGEALYPDPRNVSVLESTVRTLEVAAERVYLPSVLVVAGTALMEAAPERAGPMLARAVELAVETRQHRIESWARNVVFWFHLSAPDLEAAARAADALVASARTTGDPEGQAFGHAAQGRLCVLRGELAPARDHFAAAAALSRQEASFWSRADALTCLCSATMALGDAAASRHILEEALAFFVPLRLAGTTLLFGALARLLEEAGEPDRAARVLSAVPGAFDSVGPVTLMRADPTGSLARATREALSSLGGRAGTADGGSADLDGTLAVALDPTR